MPSKAIVNTGNVLNLIEIKQKAGQNVTEELVESLHITVAEWEKSSKTSASDSSPGEVYISRLHDDVQTKMGEEERKNLKIGIKIFLQNDTVDYLKQCLENIYKILNIEVIDNVVLAYNPSASKSDLSNSNLPNGDAPLSSSEESADGDKCDRVLPGLQNIWSALETYVQKGKICQLGVADLDEPCFKRLYGWSGVKPTIVQINLSSCCVVPPGLQAFCKDHDVQLLTHSDPSEIISPTVLGGIVNSPVTSVAWCARYQVHIKCRGVLALKGYVACAVTDKQ